MSARRLLSLIFNSRYSQENLVLTCFYASATHLQSIVSADDRVRQTKSGRDGRRQKAAVSANGAAVTGSPDGTLAVTAGRVQTLKAKHVLHAVPATWGKTSCQLPGSERGAAVTTGIKVKIK